MLAHYRVQLEQAHAEIDDVLHGPAGLVLESYGRGFAWFRRDEQGER